MFKLVIHISDKNLWQNAINNAHNTIKALHGPFDIRVIANGNAVQGYLDPEIRQKITDISHPNLQFIACNNSLVGQNITKEALNPADAKVTNIHIVPVAIIAIVEAQHEGFGYIKP